MVQDLLPLDIVDQSPGVHELIAVLVDRWTDFVLMPRLVKMLLLLTVTIKIISSLLLIIATDLVRLLLLSFLIRHKAHIRAPFNRALIIIVPRSRVIIGGV